MFTDWLSALPPGRRAAARRVVGRLKELGAGDAGEWVYSEIVKDLPRTARFLILREPWREVDGRRERSHARVAEAAAAGTLPGWALVECDPEGVPAGRRAGGLHEDLLSLDPAGREGRPA